MKRISAMLVFLFVSAVLSAQTVKKYTVVTPVYPQKEIKQIIGVLSPFFESTVEVQNENYAELIFKTAKVVREEEVKSLLRKNGFVLNQLKIEDIN